MVKRSLEDYGLSRFPVTGPKRAEPSAATNQPHWHSAHVVYYCGRIPHQKGPNRSHPLRELLRRLHVYKHRRCIMIVMMQLDFGRLMLCIARHLGVSECWKLDSQPQHSKTFHLRLTKALRSSPGEVTRKSRRRRSATAWKG